MKKIVKIIKRIIFAVLLLYGYNMLAASLNLIVPINFVTVGSITVLGTPALFAFILIQKMFY